jgi:hypothetical protein
MIEHLFFKIEEEIEGVSEKVFGALGILDRVLEGDSANVLHGIYYTVTVFGIKLKLEYNSYDYDNVYNYMLGIKQDILSNVISNDNIVSQLTNIVLILLQNNLPTEIAYELPDGTLKVYPPLK